MDMRLVDYHQPKIQEAMRALVTPEQIRSVVTGADGDPEKAKMLARQLVPDTALLEAVLADLGADSFIAGLLAGYLQLLAKVVTPVAKAVLAKKEAEAPSWDNWHPGDITAADVTVSGGLADVLNAQRISIQNITGTALENLGNVIAVSMGSGEPVNELADNLDKFGYTSPDRAGIIAHTETSRAASVAALEAYDSNAVEEYDVVLSQGACQECQDAHDGGPYPIANVDYLPPIHPWCRCTSEPHIDVSKLRAAAENLAGAGVAVEGAEQLAAHEGEETEDGLLRRLAGDLDGYLHGNVLGDYTTDLQGRRLAIAVGREAPDAADAADLSAATDEELAHAVAEAPSTTEVGEDASEALMEEIDSRDEDDAEAAGWRAALAWDGTGTPPANPYPAGGDPDLAADWQSGFDAARSNPKQATSDLRDYDANNLEG